MSDRGEDVEEARRRVQGILDQQGISYEVYEHPPVYTCEEAEGVVPPDVEAVHTKNLFLRDRKGRRHVLLVTDCAKQVDLGALAELLAVDRFSMGSERRMREHLGVSPGAVTLLALVNDPDGRVELVVDRDVWGHEALRAHPLVNTATLTLRREDVERFCRFTGHQPRIVGVPVREG